MNAVELVKRVCKEKCISIARLERDCGFSNGYIAKLRGDSFPVDRAKKIADYLGIDVEILLGLEKVNEDIEKNVFYVDKEAVEIAKAVFENPDLRLLFKAASDCKPEDLKLASDMLLRLKETNSDG